jgi:hypothetical protein
MVDASRLIWREKVMSDRCINNSIAARWSDDGCGGDRALGMHRVLCIIQIDVL